MIKFLSYLLISLTISLIYYHFLDENRNVKANRIRKFGLIALLYFFLFLVYLDSNHQ